MSTVYNIGRLSTFLASQTCTRPHMQSPAKFFYMKAIFFSVNFFVMKFPATPVKMPAIRAKVKKTGKSVKKNSCWTQKK